MQDTSAILSEALRLLDGVNSESSTVLCARLRRVLRREWNVLVSGLCSVGKSSFVSALWGDAELLPTAVRDCTQTNTLIRPPAPGETDRRIFLNWLRRDAAENFALKGLAYHRIAEMLEDFHGLSLPRLDEMLPGARLRFVAQAARKLWAERRDIMVLNEPMTDELEQLENFIEFLDSPEYRPGEAIEARWDERRENLMGRRQLDGRLTGTGRLMALEHVEIVRETSWPPGSMPVPVVVDTPWIPALHNARREDLIIEQALRADILLVLALPQRYECENWLLACLRKRPELAKTTVFVFNQADTCDPRTLFSRDGFAGIYGENLERLVKLGFDPANMLIACARLKFLKNALSAETAPAPALPFGTSSVAERIARLEKVLGHMREQLRTRPGPENDLKIKLLAACDTNDGGVETVRRRLEFLANGIGAKRQIAAAMDAILEFDAAEIPVERKTEWEAVRQAANQL